MIISTRFVKERYGTGGVYWDVSIDDIEDPACIPVVVEIPYWPNSNKVRVYRADKVYTAVLLSQNSNIISLSGVDEIHGAEGLE